MTTPNTNPAIDLGAMLERLANINPDELTDEQRLTLDRFAVARNSAMGSDRRSDVNKLETAQKLAAENARATKLFAAVDKHARDTGDELTIRWTILREKDGKGVWHYRFPSMPSRAKDEVWLPGGKDLIFTFKGQRFVNTYIVNGETKTSRGSVTAATSLCKAIGKNVESKVTPSTSLKRELAKTDSDGNPGGTSQFRTQLEDCWIQHPSVNNGKPQKLTEYFLGLDGLDEAPDEEDGNAEDESES